MKDLALAIAGLIQVPLVWKTLLASAGAVYVALMGYVALTHAKAVKDAGRPLGLFWGAIMYPSLAAFMVLDFAVNVTVFSVLFAEVPREWVVTARIQRHVDESVGWRNRFALWWGRQFNVFDEHIKRI